MLLLVVSHISLDGKVSNGLFFLSHVVVVVVVVVIVIIITF
jgi:hypothetical protein